MVYDKIFCKLHDSPTKIDLKNKIIGFINFETKFFRIQIIYANFHCI